MVWRAAAACAALTKRVYVLISALLRLSRRRADDSLMRSCFCFEDCLSLSAVAPRMPTFSLSTASVAKVVPSGRPTQLNIALASVTWAGAALMMMMTMMAMGMAMAMAMHMMAMAVAVAMMTVMMDGALNARAVATHAQNCKNGQRRNTDEMKSPKQAATSGSKPINKWHTDPT